MIDLTIESDVTELMESSQSAQELGDNANRVKSANNGYPPFWYSAVILSGLLGRVTARWGGDDKIHVFVGDG